MTIRTDIITQSPFFSLITERYPDFETSPYALAYAIEGHLRATQVLPALDGFQNLHVMKETGVVLHLIEIVFLLPSGIVPLEVSFSKLDGDISYQDRLGIQDEGWKSLTQKERWSAVDLYATENEKPQWNWEPTLEGYLKNHKEFRKLT